MNESKRRKWFQFSLSSVIIAIVLLNVFCVICFLNVKWTPWERTEGRHATDSETVHYFHRSFGWPFHVEWEFPQSALDDHGFSPSGREEIRFDLLFSKREVPSNLVVLPADMTILRSADLRGNLALPLTALILNLAFGIVLMIALAVAMIYAARRFEARKP